MNYNKSALTIVLSLLMGFLTISSSAQLFPTKLTVTVIDGLGNIVEDAEVKLFKTEADYRAGNNVLFTQKTDEKGRTKFKGVNSIAYFMEVSKGDMNNNGEGVKTSVLTAKRNNKVNVVIE